MLSLIFYFSHSAGFNNSSKPGLWGGTVSTLELKVNLTQEMNGVVYTCQSTNDALQRSVHEAIKLDVLCKYSVYVHSIHSTLLYIYIYTSIYYCH